MNLGTGVFSSMMAFDSLKLIPDGFDIITHPQPFSYNPP